MNRNKKHAIIFYGAPCIIFIAFIVYGLLNKAWFGVFVFSLALLTEGKNGLKIWRTQ